MGLDWIWDAGKYKDKPVDRMTGEFSVADLLDACPGVSIDLIRRTLKKMHGDGGIECIGMGSNAKWRRK